MGFKIGNIEIKNNIVMAPMAGISNPAYMKICESMGVGCAITELISAEAIVRNNKKTFDMLNGIDDLLIPVGIQLFGSNPETIKNAAKILTGLYKNVFIDINMGCPVPKVAIKNQAGSALLKNPQKIYEIVKSVVDNVDVAVTVKIRSGWDEKNINAIEVAKIIEKAGASAIAIHGRTRKQGYSGKADLDIIKQVKENVSIPVIGNGDIVDLKSAKNMFDYTLVDAIMIGRGLLGNPWIIKDILNGKDSIRTKEEIIKMIKKHFSLLKKYKNEHLALLEIRTHAMWYLKGLKNSAIIRQKICLCKTEKEFLDVLNEYENMD